MQLIYIPFAGDKVADQLMRGEIDLAKNVLPPPPYRIRRQTLNSDRFVCIARKGHPDFGGTLDLATFLRQPQALVAPRGSPSAAVDRALAAIDHKSNIVMSVGNF